MRLFIFFMVFSLISTVSFGQEEKKLLRNIDTIEDVAYFNESNTDYRLQSFVLSNGDDMSDSFKQIYEQEERLFQQNGRWIKELDRDRYTGSHVRYLFLNGAEYEKEELFALRDSIYQVYLDDPSEVNFIKLVNKYTMDGNTEGGLLEWYDPMSVVKKFADGVVEGKTNSVFKLDVKSRRWYYLVYKLADEKEIFKRTFVVLIKK